MDDCDPKDLFANVPKNEEDIFNYFAGHDSPDKHPQTEE